MITQTPPDLERPNRQLVSSGLRLRIGVSILLAGAFFLSVVGFIFFPDMVFTINFIRYALATLLALTLLDCAGRLLCLSWPNDRSARIAVISSSSFQICSAVVLLLGFIETTNGLVAPDLISMTIGVYLVIAAGAQAASAVLFMAFTQRACAQLGQDKLAWRPSLVLSAYGLSGVALMILILILLLLTMLAFCLGAVLPGLWLLFTTLTFRLTVGSVIAVLVVFPLSSYGRFLYELAQAIDHHQTDPPDGV